MKRLLLLALLLPMLAVAQEKGIHFEHNLSWADIKAKAKAENKYIFMDCFTTWCGPCKYMSANIFPQEEVGTFMNEKFICVKVQMDRTANDNDDVKKWYDDAKMIEDKYSVRAYPTFLYFSPDGEAVDRHVGGGEAADFIAASKASLNPENQYYTQLAAYDKGKKDPAFIRELAMLASEKYDQNNAAKFSNEYLATQKDLYTEENLVFMDRFTKTSKDKGFDMYLHHADKVDKVLGPGAADKKLIAIVAQEEIFPQLMKKDGSTPDWKAIEKNVAAKYPRVAEEAILKSKVQYFMYVKDANNAVANIVAYMKKFGHKASPMELNEFAWTIFEKCNDMKCVEQALEWSKRSLKDQPVPAFMDTYANLLFKSGKKADAITWEEKAMNQANGDEKKTYADTIEKMKKGEKYWD
ncbi:thioredoxin family protein [Chitinophaga vietnamensis]|uniref:thioredoxin family protein n=1 Tax=Chitinophaga vietnamensis TaxID=2593957 RepID=UPI001177A9D9|nr:DUF255 domain-containing protein [Chitinophaga vietnamensis]